MGISKLKVAIVHDWLVAMRGAEKCLESLCRSFPEADIFTLFHKNGAVSDVIESHTIIPSMLQGIPAIDRIYHNLVWIAPLAVEQFSFEEYDLVISSSWCCAKGVVTPLCVPHLCYMYTPMRFAWDLHESYFGRDVPGWGVSKAVARSLINNLRIWDVSSAQRPDRILAVSDYVGRRIRKSYGRDAEVLYPPVDVSRFSVGSEEDREDYFLMVTSFEPNKNVYVAIEVFNELEIPLKVVGSAGRYEQRIRDDAGNTIEFLGRVSDEELAGLYARAQALIHPAVDDFGIVAVESVASGTPVIGIDAGGVAETMVPVGAEGGSVPTAVLVKDATIDSLKRGVDLFRSYTSEVGWNREEMRSHALKYDWKHFEEGIRREVESICSKYT